MTKGKKIALISIGVIVIAFGIYFFIANSKGKLNKKQKEDRLFAFNRN